MEPIGRLFVTCAVSAYLTISVTFSPARANPFAGGEVATTAGESFSTDDRTGRAISIDMTGISLKEALRQLSTNGLTLVAGSNCAEQKIQARLKNKPLRAFMKAVSELLPGQWVKMDDGSYVLLMAKSAIERRDRWWSLFLAERSAGLRAQKSRILSAMRAASYRRQPGDPDPEGSDPRAEEETARCQDWYRSLPVVLQEKVADHIVVTPTYRSGLPYSSEAYAKEGSVSILFDQLPENVQTEIRRKSSANGEGSIIRFSNVASSVKPSIIRSDGTFSGLDLTLTVGFSPEMTAGLLNQYPIIEEVRLRGAGAPMRWKELASYQQSTVWKNDEPVKKPRRYPPYRTADILRRLANLSKLEFVADYYSTLGEPFPESEFNRPVSRTVKSELDELATDNDVSWKRNDEQIYLVRNNRWYRDDRLEVPGQTLESLMKERTCLLDSLEGFGSSSKENRTKAIVSVLDLEVRILKSLSLWQIANGLSHYVPEAEKNPFNPDKPTRCWRPFGVVTDQMLNALNTVQFYSELSAGQRRLAVEGRLPLMALSSDLQQRLLNLVPDLTTKTSTDGNSFVGIRLTTPWGGMHFGYLNPDKNEPPYQMELAILK